MLIKPILKKTPYELYKGRKQNISHLKVFGCKCYMLNNGEENIDKFEAKYDEGIFLGYLWNSHSYIIYNKWIITVEESIYVVFDESNQELHVLTENGTSDDELPDVFMKLNLNKSSSQLNLELDKNLIKTCPKNGELLKITHLTMLLDKLETEYLLDIL